MNRMLLVLEGEDLGALSVADGGVLDWGVCAGCSHIYGCCRCRLAALVLGDAAGVSRGQGVAVKRERVMVAQCKTATVSGV